MLLINGAEQNDPAHAIAVNDRGLCYGDGLFETALLRSGKVRFLEDHLQRLYHGCEKLGIAGPQRQALRDDIARISASYSDGILKIIVTRGVGGRGYRPEAGLAVTRIASVLPFTANPPEAIAARWCDTRLGRNAQLAGIKHLNRLEQVLAQREWNDPSVAEGLMLDTEGELVCGTSSNVFLVRHGILSTPDLRFCGVAGVMRRNILRCAADLGIPVTEEPLWPRDLENASEVFLTNAVRGIRPVRKLGLLNWAAAPISAKISTALEL